MVGGGYTYLFWKPSHISLLPGLGTREAFSLEDHQDADADRRSKYHTSMPLGTTSDRIQK